ncbi:MAG TPA: rod shape-determining protein MreD [Candidatus Binatia bacterium]|nr:rod shape-determining protein MreD [Candidatus Binatia bacterium]
MRRALAIVVAAVLAMVLQTTVFPALLPTAVVPNLILVLVVYLGLQQHGVAGAAGAFLLGYFLDTFSGTLLGVNAFALTAVYMAVYLVARTLWTEGGFPAMAVVFAAACVHGVAAITITWLIEAGAPLWHHALRYGLLEAAVAAIVAPAVFAFVGWEQRLLGIT